MKKFENNWKQKSIEKLEKDFWGVCPNGVTPLIEKVYRLRTLPIEELELKDIRLLIGQETGLEYLIPIALENLKGNIFLDSELFEGDLLKQVLKIRSDFWGENLILKEQLDELLLPFNDEEIENFKKGRFNL